jgi:hypothetical protein
VVFEIVCVSATSFSPLSLNSLVVLFNMFYVSNGVSVETDISHYYIGGIYEKEVASCRRVGRVTGQAYSVVNSI